MMLPSGSHDRSLRRWERSNEAFFVEEEREKKLESLFEADLERQDREGGKEEDKDKEGAGAVASAGKGCRAGAWGRGRSGGGRGEHDMEGGKEEDKDKEGAGAVASSSESAKGWVGEGQERGPQKGGAEKRGRVIGQVGATRQGLEKGSSAIGGQMLWTAMGRQ